MFLHEAALLRGAEACQVLLLVLHDNHADGELGGVQVFEGSFLDFGHVPGDAKPKLKGCRESYRVSLSWCSHRCGVDWLRLAREVGCDAGIARAIGEKHERCPTRCVQRL